MIIAWMLGATVFTALLGVAAMAVERALRATGHATRTPWVGALIVALVWPVLAPIVLRLSPPHDGISAPAIIDAPISASGMLSQQLPAMPTGALDVVTAVLVTFWALASATLLLRLVRAARALSRVQRNGTATVLDGHAVLVTESLGPAVVGLITPRVAVPEWFMQLDAPLREMVLRHEREHCQSRDPQLVWLAAVSVALMPWNVGLWMLSRRLRLALEIDCDARTLRAESNPEQYGKLLLLIAQRQSQFPLSAMLAESTSHLSRRISAMQMMPLRRPIVRVFLLGSIAAGAVAIACSPRIASDLTGPKTTPSPTAIKTTSAGAVYFEFQVEKPVAFAKGSPTPEYPEALKAAHVEGRVLAQFVVDEQGRAEPATLKLLKTDRDEFTVAVTAALPSMRFDPALVGGKPVKQLVQAPFEFAATKSTPGALSLRRTNDGRLVVSADGATLEPSKGESGKLAGVPINGPAGSSPRVSKVAMPINGQPYFEYQVEKAVAMAAGSVGPAYPAELKDQGVSGKVLAQFVVNEQGQAESGSLKILKSDNDAFDAAVKNALANMRFTPALVGNKPVRQLVQQMFQFAPSN